MQEIIIDNSVTDYIEENAKRCENTIDYEKEIKDLCDKYREELHYCQKQIDELRKENEILKLKWSVVEMIFKK